ncbi:MAG: hypothetical protein IKZ13_08710 [Akkermansia sp.]|nr:hypothetical protein [Akkermansia sp.]
MNLRYLTPVLSVAVALHAPAAEISVPATAETAADLLPLLQCVDEMTPAQARDVLSRLPVPRKCYRVLKQRMEVCKVMADVLRISSLKGEAAAAARAELLRKSPVSWLTSITLELSLATQSGGETAALKEEWVEGIKSLGPEDGMGTLRAAAVGGLLTDTEQIDPQKERMKVEIMRSEPDSPDCLAGLAVMHLYEEYGLGVDVELAMQYALRSVVTAEHQFKSTDFMRNNLCLSLARAAALKGEAALPLQVAALRRVEKESESSAGLAAYRLAKLYLNMPENLEVVPEEFAQILFKEGASLGEPACLHELSLLAEEPEVKEQFQNMAQAKKFDASKDYLNGSHGRPATVGAWWPEGNIFDPVEQEVWNGILKLLNRMEWEAEASQEPENMKAATQWLIARFFSQFSWNDKQEEAYMERADDEEDKSFERVKKFFDGMMGASENEVKQNVDEFLAHIGNTYILNDAVEDMGAENLVRLQKMAEAGHADPMYILAWRQVRFLGSFTESSWELMCEAYKRGSAGAAWFLFEAMWDGLYGLESDPASATACYRTALARLSAEAWQRRLDRSEDEAVRLHALVHMRHSHGGERFSLQLDDALQAYAATHPELQSIITPLRLLYMRQADSLPAEEEKELQERMLELFIALQPSVMSADDVAQERAAIEYEYVTALHNERAAQARKALPLLKSGSADLALVKEKKVLLAECGEARELLQSWVQNHAQELKGAHLVCRDCNRELAEAAIQAGVKSVTALRMPAGVRDYLRSRQLSAGGWEIVR